MTDPVFVPEKRRVYERGVYKANLSRYLAMPALTLKAEIQSFCKSTLEQLEGNYKQVQDSTEEIALIVAECLSGLSSGTDLWSSLRGLQQGHETFQKSVLSKLSEIFSPTELMSFTAYLIDSRDFVAQALILLRELMCLRDTDHLAFSCVVPLLVKAFSLLEEATELPELAYSALCQLSKAQLEQLTKELVQIDKSSTQTITDDLMLRYSLQRHSEGNYDCARILLVSLYDKACLQKPIEEFFALTGWKDEHTKYLEVRGANQVKQDVSSRGDFIPLQPKCIYSYNQGTNELYITLMHTQAGTYLQLPSFTFRSGCYWVELPCKRLVVTGGGDKPTREAVAIDSSREFAVNKMSPMLYERSYHSAVVYANYLYVIGGEGLLKYALTDCERYDLIKNTWEEIEPLPKACYGLGAQVSNEFVYVLGGYIDSRALNSIQRLNLDTLKWDLLTVTLPAKEMFVICFIGDDSKLYFSVMKKLYRLTSTEVQYIKELYEFIGACGGPSYYYGDILYYSNREGPALKLNLGKLI